MNKVREAIIANGLYASAKTALKGYKKGNMTEDELVLALISVCQEYAKMKEEN